MYPRSYPEGESEKPSCSAVVVVWMLRLECIAMLKNGIR